MPGNFEKILSVITTSQKHQDCFADDICFISANYCAKFHSQFINTFRVNYFKFLNFLYGIDRTFNRSCQEMCHNFPSTDHVILKFCPTCLNKFYAHAKSIKKTAFENFKLFPENQLSNNTESNNDKQNYMRRMESNARIAKIKQRGMSPQSNFESYCFYLYMV